ncbi:MAG: hypothetical protein ACPGVB_06710 [Chitinophagales bacterium]
MAIKKLSILVMLFFLTGFTVFSQNSTEAAGSIGPASSLKIDTTPIEASTAIKKKNEFLTKYEFYTEILNRLPFGWQLSERESNIIISRSDVVVQKSPLEISINDPVLAEEQATLQYGKRTYELVLRFESYPKSQYVGAKEKFGNVNEELEKLEEKYAVADMKLDDGTGWFIAKNKDEKNRLVFYHIERAMLDEQLNPIPDFYVENYAITIDKGNFYKLYPVNVESQLSVIIQHIHTLLK